MATVDLTQPQVIAAVIGAAATVTAAIITVRMSKKKKKDSPATGQQLVQKSKFSKDIQQIQAGGNITMSTPPAKRSK